MAYTETTTTSYGGRIKGALGGIVAGVVLFIGGTGLLFWNEGNFVKTEKALEEGEGAVVAIESVDKVDPALNGKFIHATAMADTKDVLEDSAFGVKETAIALKRRVEFYQYVENSKTEKRDKLGGGQESVTTYTYALEWRNGKVDSANFKDPQYRGRNFALYDAESDQSYARNVSFGAYTLPDFFVKSIGGEEPAEVKLAPAQIDALDAAARRVSHAAAANGLGYSMPAYATSTASLVHAGVNSVYIGTDSNVPQLGDVRVTFTKVSPKQVSILAKVNGNTFGKFVAKNGKTVSALSEGAVSAEEMFAGKHSGNSLFTWCLRILGIVLVCGGLKAFFGLFEAVAMVVPFLGGIVGAGVGLFCLLFGLAWCFLWIALAWVTYRPLIGVPLLAVSVALIFWLRKKKAGAGKAALSAAQPSPAGLENP